MEYIEKMASADSLGGADSLLEDILLDLVVDMEGTGGIGISKLRGVGGRRQRVGAEESMVVE